MSYSFSRRDFLKLGGLSLASLAIGRYMPDFTDFDDSNLVRVATKSVSVYSAPSDDPKKSIITGTWYKDDLIHVYDEVTAQEPKLNPIWYRVWGGYVWRGRLQRVKTILNLPLASIPEGKRLITEVTVPFTQPWRLTKTYGWQLLNFRLYYESVHWIEAIEEGPDGRPWYRVFDELAGTYYVSALHLRQILPETLDPISPEIPWENKRIDLNLTTQTLEAYEYDNVVFRSTISSGIPGGRDEPNGISTTTPSGRFHIQDKMPSKHMGNGNLFAGADDYELPGVPWTCFFTEVGHAFHGTYWHENFGTPMSRGCVNMRTSDAKWIFRWARPPHKADALYNRGYGTTVDIHY